MFDPKYFHEIEKFATLFPFFIIKYSSYFLIKINTKDHIKLKAENSNRALVKTGSFRVENNTRNLRVLRVPQIIQPKIKKGKGKK